MFKSRFWRNFDPLLLGVTLLLVITGILILYSITFKAANLTSPVDASNQIIFAAIGLIALVGLASLDYRVWAQYAPVIYVVSLVLLGVVMLTKPVLGASRWINLGFFQFQPSELTKLVIIIVLAKFMASHYEEMSRPRFLLWSLGYVLLPIGLVLAQPDLGTALVLGFIWLAMVLVSRANKWHLAALAAAVLVAVPLIYPHLAPYQKQRLQSFANPTADPLSTGYNVVQSTIAVGSGEWFGRGLAAGSQSQLNFLPSQHTDFVFAVLAEKLGFFGSLILLLLFAVLLIRMLIIAWRAQDRFGLFLAVGIAAMFLFHVAINVGMNVGIAPVTGIPLPFISYGGTSLLVGLAAIGILESIAVRRKKIEFGT